MKRSHLLAALIVAAVLLLGGCGSAPSAIPDAPTADEVSEAKALGKGPFEAVMLALIDKARKGDINGVIALNSKIATELTGKAVLRKDVAEDWVPFFKRSTMEPGGSEEFVGTFVIGKPGWRFFRTFVVPEGKKLTVAFDIARENGRIVLVSLNLAAVSP